MSRRLLGFIQVIKRVFQDPYYFPVSVIAFLRGSFYILYYRIFRRNVKIGFPFSAFAPVRIVGPGSVSIKGHCYVFKNVFKGLTIITYSPDALVEIGGGCLLGGVTIRCRKQVKLGDKAMTAVSLIQDSFFLDQEKTDALIVKGLLPQPRPVTIGENVWLGADSIVLWGSVIGRDSVLSAGTGCYASAVDDYCLVTGNPAKKPLSIERLLKLKGTA